MTATDYAHTAHAEQLRSTKAKTLARWCYARGISADIVHEPVELLRAIARRATVSPSHDAGAGATWSQVAELLQRRARWDHDHGIQAPAAPLCVSCVVLGARCPKELCCVDCGIRMDPYLRLAGFRAHPDCRERMRHHPYR